MPAAFDTELFVLQLAILKIYKIYRTLIFYIVFYWCVTWSLILTEEDRLRLIENRVVRKIFGAKWGGGQ
jgi:hypothetical protein